MFKCVTVNSNNFYASANIVQAYAVCFLAVRAAVRPCILNVVNTILKYWTYFQVTVGPTCWKMHFLASLTRYLENCWTEFPQTFSVDEFWDKGERVKFLGSKIMVTSQAYGARQCVLSSNF